MESFARKLQVQPKCPQSSTAETFQVLTCPDSQLHVYRSFACCISILANFQNHKRVGMNAAVQRS